MGIRKTGLPEGLPVELPATDNDVHPLVIHALRAHYPPLASALQLLFPAALSFLIMACPSSASGMEEHILVKARKINAHFLYIGFVFSIVVLCFIMGAAVSVHGAEFSYYHYEALLKRYVKPDMKINGIGVSAVDYAALAQDALKPDSPYSLLLRDLATFDPATLENKEERMAFWVNVYNIAAIKTIVDHYPVDSIRSRKINWLGLPWSRKAITINGKEYALEEIEFGKLVEGFKDLRVHFGINCASVSCVEYLRTGTFDVEYLEYDWNVNDLKNVK